MKKLLYLILFMFFAVQVTAQEIDTYQADSVYARNKVRTRYWYTQPGKKLYLTTLFDHDGRRMSIKYPREVTGIQLSTHYFYDRKGRVGEVHDTIAFYRPDFAAVTEMQKRGVYVDVPKNKDPFEIGKYKVKYEDDELRALIAYHPDGTLNRVQEFEGNGHQVVTLWFRDKEIVRFDTAVYDLDPLHRVAYYGCETNREFDPCWDYVYEHIYDGSGVLMRTNRYVDSVLDQTTDYFYHNNGLLMEMRTGQVSHVFTYEFFP